MTKPDAEARRCDLCRAPMKLACALPAMDRFPALQIFECTACRFARPVQLDGNLLDLRRGPGLSPR
jgi:hypothetical protein